MKTYLDCWISAATTLFSQALVGEPQLTELKSIPPQVSGLAFVAEISGDVAGRFSITLEAQIVTAPLLGDGVDQAGAWMEFLREVAEAAAGELLATTGMVCRIDVLRGAEPAIQCTRSFRLSSPGGSWIVLVLDELQTRVTDAPPGLAPDSDDGAIKPVQLSTGVELLLDVELEAALRFGCCVMPLGEILELGPGDVVELDRHVADPVDLVVGDKIVARGEVVLVNGNFGLRVSEVAAPQKRLESIRCLF